MNGNSSSGMMRSERLKGALMMFCALILFVLGMWLLIEPGQGRGSDFHASIRSVSLGTGALVDNVVANSSSGPVRPNGLYRR